MPSTAHEAMLSMYKFASLKMGLWWGIFFILTIDYSFNNTSGHHWVVNPLSHIWRLWAWKYSPVRQILSSIAGISCATNILVWLNFFYGCVWSHSNTPECSSHRFVALFQCVLPKHTFDSFCLLVCFRQRVYYIFSFTTHLYILGLYMPALLVVY